MKTKMIVKCNMLVFNDINKPHRKFHLCAVIASASQVALCDYSKEGECGHFSKYTWDWAMMRI